MWDQTRSSSLPSFFSSNFFLVGHRASIKETFFCITVSFQHSISVFSHKILLFNSRQFHSKNVFMQVVSRDSPEAQNEQFEYLKSLIVVTIKSWGFCRIAKVEICINKHVCIALRTTASITVQFRILIFSSLFNQSSVTMHPKFKFDVIVGDDFSGAFHKFNSN